MWFAKRFLVTFLHLATSSFLTQSAVLVNYYILGLACLLTFLLGASGLIGYIFDSTQKLAK